MQSKVAVWEGIEMGGNLAVLGRFGKQSDVWEGIEMERNLAVLGKFCKAT